MSAAELIARGDPVAPGLPSELEVLAVLVGSFWVLVGLIVLALWLARRQHRRPDAVLDEHLAPPDDRDLTVWTSDLRMSMPEPKAPPTVRHGRHSAS